MLQFKALPGDSGTVIDLQFNGQRQTVQSWQRDELVHVFCDLGATVITELDALAHADVTHDFVASVDHAPPDSTSADTGDQKCDREPFSENASVVTTFCTSGVK